MIYNLEKNDLFLGIPSLEIEAILKNFQVKKFRKAETLYREGSELHELLILVKGEVEISDYDYNGNKKIIAILGENEIFAESIAFSNQKKTPFHISSLSNIEVLSISSNRFYHIDHKLLFINMMKILSNKNTFLTHKIECLNKTTIKERVYEVLKYYSYSNGSLDLELPYNKTQLAEYLCVNRSALTREIKKMEQEGYFINIKNRYELQHEYFKSE